MLYRLPAASSIGNSNSLSPYITEWRNQHASDAKRRMWLNTGNAVICLYPGLQPLSEDSIHHHCTDLDDLMLVWIVLPLIFLLEIKKITRSLYMIVIG